ncbi:MAG: large conductance mechanosensitive channel protein MscL [Burkholderiaceae bacterium]|nr:large conductance mechanosensitive channel protein MscL [Burkholderiaceae bacterium]
MTILKEFREFAVRGNVIDLAVGVIIGGAFSLIVNSMVKDVVMPLVNFLVGGAVDFSNKFYVLSMPDAYAGPMTYQALTAAGATVFAWGNFLTVVINFVLLAFIIFWMVKIINNARKRMESEKEAAPAKAVAPPEDVALLREIRDLLKTGPARDASSSIDGLPRV